MAEVLAEGLAGAVEVVAGSYVDLPAELVAAEPAAGDSESTEIQEVEQLQPP